MPIVELLTNYNWCERYYDIIEYMYVLFIAEWTKSILLMFIDHLVGCTCTINIKNI